VTERSDLVLKWCLQEILYFNYGWVIVCFYVSNDKMATRVLIADDSQIVRGIIRTFLARRPNVEICGETADGRETIDAALTLRPDLLILDVLMPEFNGIEVASILKKSLPNTKTILFTMYGDFIKSLAIAAGVSVIVSKSDGLSPLLSALETFLN
jgi:DNA-binding NarL/FixJ family response regulator